MQVSSTQSGNESPDSEILPLLNDAIASLPKADRDAVVLKFLQGKSHREVAQTLQTTENAARQRMFRAIARLRAFFEQRGVPVTEAALGAALAPALADPAPFALAARVGAALQGTPTATSATIAKGVIHMMLRYKLKTAAAILAVLFVAGVIITFARAGVEDSREQTAGSAPRANAPSTNPATRPAADLTPKGLVVAAYRAGLAGDEQAMIGCFDKLTPQQETSLRQVVRLQAAAQELSKTTTARFGAAAGEQMLTTLGLGVSPADIAGATETIEGQSAIVDMGKSGPGKVPVVRVGNTWKVSAEVFRGFNAPAVAQLEPLIPAFKVLAADVAAGEFKTVEELQQALAKMMQPGRQTRP